MFQYGNLALFQIIVKQTTDRLQIIMLAWLTSPEQVHPGDSLSVPQWCGFPLYYFFFIYLLYIISTPEIKWWWL